MYSMYRSLHMPEIVSALLRSKFNAGFRRPLATPVSMESSRAGTIEVLQTKYVPEIYPPDESANSNNPSEPDQPKLFQSAKTLIRSETAILDERIIKPLARSSKPPNVYPKFILVDGLKGVGKSTLLTQVVASTRANGFVTIYIPDARHWTDGPGFFCPTVTEGMDLVEHGVSAIRYYDRPVQIGRIFADLLQAHADILKDIPCTHEMSTESTKHCATIHDLVTHGLQMIERIDVNWHENPSIAADALHRVIRELSKTPDIPFSLVIDNYHTLIGLTCMVDERNRRLHANCIRTVAEYLGRSAIENSANQINRGFILVAAEQEPPFMPWRRSRVLGTSDYPLSDDIRREPSGRLWFEGLRSRVAHPDNLEAMHVRLPDFLPGELKAVCATFAPRGLGREMTQSEKRGLSDRLVMLSGGRGNVMQTIFNTR